MITRKFALRRRIMSSNVIKWTLAATSQWGSGTTRTFYNSSNTPSSSSQWHPLSKNVIINAGRIIQFESSVSNPFYFTIYYSASNDERLHVTVSKGANRYTYKFTDTCTQITIENEKSSTYTGDLYYRFIE